MWKSKTNIVICLILITVSGCSNKESEQYFPLTDGARWEYSMEISMPLGGVQKAKVAMRVDGDETINGKRYVKVVSVPSGIPGSEVETDYLRAAKDGIYKISGKYKDSGEVLELPYPLEVGQEWTTKGPDGEKHFRVEAKETAELFDKKYEDSFRISIEGAEITDSGTANISGVSYYAPEIGMVKSIIVMTLNPIKISTTIELIKYEK